MNLSVYKSLLMGKWVERAYVKPKRNNSVAKVFVDPQEPKYMVLLFWVKGNKVPCVHYLKPMTGQPMTMEDAEDPDFQKLVDQAIKWCRMSKLFYPGVDDHLYHRK